MQQLPLLLHLHDGRARQPEIERLSHRGRHVERVLLLDGIAGAARRDREDVLDRQEKVGVHGGGRRTAGWELVGKLESLLGGGSSRVYCAEEILTVGRSRSVCTRRRRRAVGLLRFQRGKSVSMSEYLCSTSAVPAAVRPPVCRCTVCPSAGSSDRRCSDQRDAPPTYRQSADACYKQMSARRPIRSRCVVPCRLYGRATASFCTADAFPRKFSPSPTSALLLSTLPCTPTLQALMLPAHLFHATGSLCQAEKRYAMRQRDAALS